MLDVLNSIFPSATDMLNVIIMAFFLGAVIAGFLILYQKRALGKLVRALIHTGASTPETAKSLKDLKLDYHFLIHHSLRDNSSFRRVISVVQTEQSPDNSAAGGKKRKAKHHHISDRTAWPLYIDDANLEKAEALYSDNGSALLHVLLSLLALSLVAFLSYLLVPMLLDFANNLLS